MTTPGPSDLPRVVLLALIRFALAAAVFGAAELFASDVLGADRMPLALVVVATGVVAVLFWASSAPVQRLVDRLLFGEQATGFEAGRALLRRMATTLPVDDILPALAETAGRTTHSARAEVRVLLSDGQPWSQVWPPRAVADGSEPVTIGVRHAGADVGEIEVDLADSGEADRDRDLLGDLARPAGLALSTVRLTVDLRRRAAELQKVTDELELSNRRIAVARRTEIDRLRAEMAARVLPHIDRADAIVDLESAGTGDQPTARPETSSGTDTVAPAAVDRALAEVADALESLRTLARGIYPPRLADAGLAVSLEGWQQRSGIGMELHLHGEDDALRRHPDAEACLYFSIVTVLGAIGAGAIRPVVTLAFSSTDADAVISGEASDDPRTAAVWTAALQAVRDRIEAFDGRLAVDAPQTVAATTAVRLWLPLADPASSVPGHTGTAP